MAARAASTERRAEASAVAAEYPEWKVSLPFGLFFRADYRRPPKGVTVAHYEDDTAEGLRAQLAAVTGAHR